MAKAPPSRDDLRYCPLIGRQCIGDACAWWVGIWGTKGKDGEPVFDEECAIVWDVLLSSEQLIETARVTEGQDKVAAVSHGFNVMVASAIRARQETALDRSND